jgi:small subunit ribosomal protein S1
MSEKKQEEQSIKTLAVDTGKRIDVSGVEPKKTTIRRFDEKKKPKVHEPRLKEPVKEEKAPLIIEKISEEIPVRLISNVEPLEIDESGDFASLLDESEAQSKDVSLSIGDKVSGKIIHIGADHAFIALGTKLEAAMDRIELCDAEGNLLYSVGDPISAYVSSVQGGVTISNKAAQSSLDSAMLEDAMANRAPVEGKVLSVNKGGFEIGIGQKRAFCPIGQIDLRFVEDPSTFVGKVLAFLIQRIEEGGRNIVVSRRSLLEREAKDKALKTIENLEKEKRYQATITRVTDFGAFADIGGLEGLIPRSELSYGRFEKVSDVLSTNDRVEVQVLSFEINQENPLKSKLTLSLKSIKEDPYKLYWNKISEGSSMEGRVVRLESFGAFVELFPGIDGLIHISELAESRISHPKDVLRLGDPVSVRILKKDDQEKRISLSLREQVLKHRGEDKTPVRVERGQKVSGVVSRIERYGIFLELDNGITALLPQSETGLPKNAELSKSFPLGEKFDALVIDVDSQNRVRLSMVARKAMEERDSFVQFKSEEEKRFSKFGSLGDLIKKVKKE